MSYTYKIPSAPFIKLWVILLNLSCPAVSQICKLISILFIFIFFILYSTPIVATYIVGKYPSAYFNKRLVFPTRESPIIAI